MITPQRWRPPNRKRANRRRASPRAIRRLVSGRQVTTADQAKQLSPTRGAQSVASANRPATQTTSETSDHRASKSPWSLFRTVGTSTRNVAQTSSPSEIGKRLPDEETQSAADAIDVADHSPAVSLREAGAQRGFEAIRFPRPEPLIAELTALARDPNCGPWAATASRLLGEICGEPASARRPAPSCSTNCVGTASKAKRWGHRSGTRVWPARSCELNTPWPGGSMFGTRSSACRPGRRLRRTNPDRNTCRWRWKPWNR